MPRITAVQTASAALWILVLWVSWQCIVLNSDGSLFFVSIVSKGWFLNYGDASRQHAIWLTQIPLILGLKAGLSNLHWLAVLFSLGTLGVPAFFYQVALVRAKNDTLLLALVIVTIAVVFMTTCLFSVGEYNTAYAVAIAAMAVAATQQEPRLADGMVLMLLGLVSMRSYEAFLYLGPLIAAIVLWTRPPDTLVKHAGLRAALLMLLPIGLAGLALIGKYHLPIVIMATMAGLMAFARGMPRRRTEAILIGYLFAAALFMADGIVGAESFLRKGGLTYASKIAVAGMGAWHNLAFALALLTIASFIIALRTRARLLQVLPVVPLASLAVLPILLSQAVPDRPLATLHYVPRTMCGLLIAAALATAWARPIGAIEAKRGLALSLAMLIALLPSTLFAASEYNAMMEEFRHAIRSEKGTIALAQAPPLVCRFFWDPSDQAFIEAMALALRSKPGDAVIVAPPGVNVDPAPDLRDYFWRD